MKGKIIKTIAVLFALSLLVIVMLLVSNNQKADEPTRGQLENSLEQSIQWMVANGDKVVNDNNAMLWWMIDRSIELNSDPRLRRLYLQYRSQYIDREFANPWRLLFYPDARIRRLGDNINRFPDYNQYFLYGLSCSPELESLLVIEQQKETSFCRKNHPISPACVTHQMMGLRFRQRSNCGEAQEMAAQVVELQDLIVQQLTYDPRVVDVYLQRVLMLLDTGAAERVQASWLQAVLAAQVDDGGWSNMQPLLPLGGGRYLGFSAKLVGVGKHRSTFHATAQGIMIMSILLAQADEKAGQGAAQ